jgi:hypothetical protein
LQKYATKPYKEITNNINNNNLFALSINIKTVIFHTATIAKTKIKTLKNETVNISDAEKYVPKKAHKIRINA